MTIDSVMFPIARHAPSFHTALVKPLSHFWLAQILLSLIAVLLLGCPSNPPNAKVFHISIADFRSAELSPTFDTDLRRKLTEKLGYAQPFEIDFVRCSLPRTYFADCISPTLAKQPEVFYATTTTMAMEAKRLFPKQKILFSGLFDPVEQGLVKSYDEPGENTTGFVSFADGGRKRLELLWQAFPQIRKIGILAPPGTLDSKTLADRRAFATQHGRTLDVAAFDHNSTREEIDAIIRSGRFDAFDVPSTPALRVQYQNIIKGALSSKKPCMFMHPDFVKLGGLMSYGPVEFDYADKAAEYLARIAKGEPIGSIPVETPSQFDLALNSKTLLALTSRPNQTFLLRVTTFIDITDRPEAKSERR